MSPFQGNVIPTCPHSRAMWYKHAPIPGQYDTNMSTNILTCPHSRAMWYKHVPIPGQCDTYMSPFQGNVILTDNAYTILNLLRTRTDVDTDVRFAVRETFALDSVKNEQPAPTPDQWVSQHPCISTHTWPVCITTSMHQHPHLTSEYHNIHASAPTPDQWVSQHPCIVWVTVVCRSTSMWGADLYSHTIPVSCLPTIHEFNTFELRVYKGITIVLSTSWCPIKLSWPSRLVSANVWIHT